MRNKIKLSIGLFLIWVVLLSFGVSGAASFISGATYTNHQYQPSFQTYYSGSDRNTYWPILGDKDQCKSRQDILLNVAPGGCQPAVVRSDLLADQNVPVFCQIDALQINPLIDIKQLNNIRFSGQYPKEIVGTGFHPANAALRTRDKLLGDPLINNIGYVVVVLKKNENESSLPGSVHMNLTAKVEYTAGNAYGIGRAEFVLKPVTDEEWKDEKLKQSFWNGRYFVRLESADSNFAIVSLYNGDKKISTTKVLTGKTSDTIYMPGLYCQAGVQINYAGFVSDDDRALLQVGDANGNTDRVEVFEGTRILDGKCTVRSINVYNSTGSVSIYCSGGEQLTLYLRDRYNETGVNSSVLSDTKFDDAIAEQAFNDAISHYEAVADKYGSERSSLAAGSEQYGETALIKAIDLSRYGQAALYKQKTQAKLLQKFVDMYPNSQATPQYQEQLREFYVKDSSLAGSVVEIDSDFKTIRLISLTSVEEKGKSSVDISVIGTDNNLIPVHLVEGSYISLSNKSNSDIDSIRLDKIVDEENVQISVYCKENVRRNTNRFGAFDYSWRSQISMGKYDSAKEVCKKTMVKLENINMQKIAKIRLEPYTKGTQIETNLSVNIGIEKRAIQLNPDKTESMIKSLNDSISGWDSISKKLANVVKGMKGACFATSAVLTVKNFLDGADGTAISRKEVMTGSNGWNKRCQDAIYSGKIDRVGDGKSSVQISYKTMTECYNGEKEYINKDVSARAKVIQDVNTKIQSVEAGLEKKGDLISGYEIDSTDARNKFVDFLKQSEFSSDSFVQGLQKSTKDNPNVAYSYDDLRTWYTNKLLEKQGINVNGAKTDIKTIVDKVTDNQRLINEANSANGEGLLSRSLRASSSGRTYQTILYRFSEDRATLDKFSIISSDAVNDIKSKGGGGELYGGIVPGQLGVPNEKQIQQKSWYLVIGRRDGGKLNPIAVYNYTEVSSSGGVKSINLGIVQTDVNNFMLTNGYDSVVDAGGELVGNNIAAKDRVVRYFETGPDKGRAAVVPFDVNNGWYASVNAGTSGTNQISAYDSSGLPKSWNICNVGADKVIDSSDLCQGVILGVNSNSPILGLSSQKSKDLVDQSQKALMDATRQYGNKIITVNKQTLYQGNPKSQFDNVQCQDFMSIEDCQLLFNVCDPVICPATRCNLGGAYQVSDVIQTGIVGSALLCLPNIREGVYIPVCLTGIQAGIDSYVSILKSHRDCLQENLDGGKMVGICDEIYSIYLCEFFWRQIAPIANIILPKVVEMAYGQSGARGGGEYMSVMAAWDNAKASINYFTQTYAVNSMKAFQVRNIEEAGGEFCKNFVSVKAPTAFKNLIEPDSPTQFYAYFDEIVYSSATVPATSQYKVFYHIFAGNDAGVYYSVYLKNPPTSAYYYSTQTIQVASGFAGKGQYASETKDFTAPEGYKELCVRINNEERCGFKQVSTDFAVNYLKDAAVSSELTKTTISSSSECISGSVNVGNMLNPNLQAGIESTAIPQTYQQGVVRICSDKNPGATTDPLRYVNVGHCDDKAMTCWLDKQSVSNAITEGNLGVKNATLSALEQKQKKDAMNANIGVLADDVATGLLRDFDSEIRNAISKMKGKSVAEAKAIADNETSRLDSAFGPDLDKLFYNSHKAQVKLFKAALAEAVTQVYLSSSGANQQVVVAGQAGQTANSQNILGSAINSPVYDSEGRLKVDFGTDSSGKYIGSYGLNSNGLLEWYNVSTNSWIDVDGKWKRTDISTEESNWLVQLKSELVNYKNTASVSSQQNQQNTQSSSKKAPIGSSILLFNNIDFQKCSDYVRSAKSVGAPAVNLIPTLYADINSKNEVKGYYIKKIVNGQDTFEQMSSSNIAYLSLNLKNCIQTAYGQGFLIIVTTPHLDWKPGSSGYSWRNGYIFSPTAKIDGFSYDDVLLQPLSKAVLSLSNNARVDFSMQGEMGGTLFDYSKEWEGLITNYKDTFRQNGFSNVRVGINTNYNQLAGILDKNNNGPDWRDSDWFGDSGAYGPQHNQADFQNLVNSVDYIGFSAYEKVSNPVTVNSFWSILADYKNKYTRNGITLSGDSVFRFSEAGLGGGESLGLCKDGSTINNCPWEGPMDVQAKMCEKNVWNDPAASQLRKSYYDSLIEFMKWGDIDSAYLWNLDTWDVQGIYPTSERCKDSQIASSLQEYNRGLS